MKHLTKFLLCLLFCSMGLSAYAQDTLRVTPCEERGGNSVVANAELKQRDRNGKMCAVLQIQGPHIKDYTFECSYMKGEPIYDELHNTATLIISPEKKRNRLVIFHPETTKKTIELPPLTGLKYYDMQINVMHDAKTEPKKLEREIELEFNYRVPAKTPQLAAQSLLRERAQIDAIAWEFGSDRLARPDTTGSEFPSAINPDALLSTEVNGIWLSDLDEPKIKKLHKDKVTGDDVYRVHLNIRARERVALPVSTQIKLLRNDQNSNESSSAYVHGDKLYIKFNSQSDGYLLAYLVDNDGNCFNIVPHWNSHDRVKRIRGRVNYVLLSDLDIHAKEDDAVPRGLELTCTPGLTKEWNSIWILYSPNKLSKQLTKASEGKGESAASDITYPAFQDWLNDLRQLDEELQVTQHVFSVSQKGSL